MVDSNLDLNLHRPKNIDPDLKTVMNFLIPENNESLIIFLFKAGACLDFISEACTISLSLYTTIGALPVRSMNLFQLVVFNGFIADEAIMVCEKKMHSRDELLMKAMTWYHELMCKPLTLFQLNRIAIRKQLLQASSHRSILPLIDKLPLPTDVKLYMKFEGFRNEIDVKSSN